MERRSRKRRAALIIGLEFAQSAILRESSEDCHHHHSSAAAAAAHLLRFRHVVREDEIDNGGRNRPPQLDSEMSPGDCRAVPHKCTGPLSMAIFFGHRSRTGRTIAASITTVHHGQVVVARAVSRIAIILISLSVDTLRNRHLSPRLGVVFRNSPSTRMMQDSCRGGFGKF